MRIFFSFEIIFQIHDSEVNGKCAGVCLCVCVYLFVCFVMCVCVCVYVVFNVCVCVCCLCVRDIFIYICVVVLCLAVGKVQNFLFFRNHFPNSRQRGEW